LKSGQEIAIEIQNSKITPNEIIRRINDYNSEGIYVLWILYGEGKCVASPKYPINTKRVKISLAESTLHRIYGGRVYYVNLDIHNNKLFLQIPFALHFSKPIKKKLRVIFKTRYESYIVRDSIFTHIPSWKLLCTEFSGYKIARFYDKNLKTVLKEKIVSIYYKEKEARFKEKRIIKAILVAFEKKYGQYMIYYVIIELVNEHKIDFCRKIISKIQKKIL
ncbi:MAG: competence protein CoiA family protein, partial [Promethearchaeota archaeon]